MNKLNKILLNILSLFLLSSGNIFSMIYKETKSIINEKLDDEYKNTLNLMIINLRIIRDETMLQINENMLSQNYFSFNVDNIWFMYHMNKISIHKLKSSKTIQDLKQNNDLISYRFYTLQNILNSNNTDNIKAIFKILFKEFEALSAELNFSSINCLYSIDLQSFVDEERKLILTLIGEKEIIRSKDLAFRELIINNINRIKDIIKNNYETLSLTTIEKTEIYNSIDKKFAKIVSWYFKTLNEQYLDKFDKDKNTYIYNIYEDKRKKLVKKFYLEYTENENYKFLINNMQKEIERFDEEWQKQFTIINYLTKDKFYLQYDKSENLLTDNIENNDNIKFQEFKKTIEELNKEYNEYDDIHNQNIRYNEYYNIEHYDPEDKEPQKILKRQEFNEKQEKILQILKEEGDDFIVKQFYKLKQLLKQKLTSKIISYEEYLKIIVEQNDSKFFFVFNDFYSTLESIYKDFDNFLLFLFALLKIQKHKEIKDLKGSNNIDSQNLNNLYFKKIFELFLCQWLEPTKQEYSNYNFNSKAKITQQQLNVLKEYTENERTFQEDFKRMEFQKDFQSLYFIQKIIFLFNELIEKHTLFKNQFITKEDQKYFTNTIKNTIENWENHLKKIITNLLVDKNLKIKSEDTLIDFQLRYLFTSKDTNIIKIYQLLCETLKQFDELKKPLQSFSQSQPFESIKELKTEFNIETDIKEQCVKIIFMELKQKIKINSLEEIQTKIIKLNELIKPPINKLRDEIFNIIKLQKQSQKQSQNKFNENKTILINSFNKFYQSIIDQIKNIKNTIEQDKQKISKGLLSNKDFSKYKNQEMQKEIISSIKKLINDLYEELLKIIILLMDQEKLKDLLLIKFENFIIDEIKNILIYQNQSDEEDFKMIYNEEIFDYNEENEEIFDNKHESDEEDNKHESDEEDFKMIYNEKIFEEQATQSILKYFDSLNPDNKNSLKYDLLNNSTIESIPFEICMNPITLRTTKEIKNYADALNEFISNFSQLNLIQQIKYLLENISYNEQSTTNIKINKYLITDFFENIQYLRIQYDIRKNIDILFDSFSKNVESSLKFFVLYDVIQLYSRTQLKFSGTINDAINFYIKNINNEEFFEKHKSFIEKHESISIFSLYNDLKKYLNEIINPLLDDVKEDELVENAIRRIETIINSSIPNTEINPDNKNIKKKDNDEKKNDAIRPIETIPNTAFNTDTENIEKKDNNKDNNQENVIVEFTGHYDNQCKDDHDNIVSDNKLLAASESLVSSEQNDSFEEREMNSSYDDKKNFAEQITQHILNYFNELNSDSEGIFLWDQLQNDSINIDVFNTIPQTKEEINNYTNSLNKFIDNFSQLNLIQQIKYLLEYMNHNKESKTNIENLIIYFFSNIKCFFIQYDIPENIDILFGSFSKNVESSLRFFVLYDVIQLCGETASEFSGTINNGISFYIKKNINNKEFLEKYKGFIQKYISIFLSYENLMEYLNEIINPLPDDVKEHELVKNLFTSIKQRYNEVLINFFTNNENFLQPSDLKQIFSEEELKGLNINIEEMTK